MTDAHTTAATAPTATSPSPRTARPRGRGALAARSGLGLALCCGLVGALPGSAVALPVPPLPAYLPSGVESLQPYIGQAGCDPVSKPGVLAFQSLLMSTYRDTGSLGIVRDCGIGDQSEHKEGRAFDWAVSVNNANHVAEVKAVTDWLIAYQNGEFAANARRFGIMYMIFNHRIWKAYQPERGWQPYTGSNPHTDHVHFSFGWNGARKATSWWTGRVAPLDYGPFTSSRPPAPVPPGAPVRTPIDVKHDALGGDSGWMGPATGPETSVLNGRYRPYQNGVLYFSEATGAHEMHGDIWKRYLALGGSRSPLGLPTSDETAAPGGRQNAFQAGSILWSPATGAHGVYGDIDARYDQLAGPAGVLGLPVSDEEDVPGGRQVMFQGGPVVWANNVGARAVYGDIASRYVAAGGAEGPLGLPMGEETDIAGNGRAVPFQNGAVVWAAGIGAHLLYAPANDRWAALGAATGYLGMPVSDDETVDGGRQAVFAGGRVLWSRATGAQALHGEIEDRYAKLGGADGPLGLPTGEEVDVAGGRAVTFQEGRIVWSAGTGAKEVRGAIADKYQALGGEAGMLRLPITGELAAGPGRVSSFQAGDLYWSAATGAHEVHGAIRALWVQLGGATSGLGLPRTDEREEPGGRSEGFANGSVYWSPGAGAHTLYGSIGQRYLADGGAGRYGLPVTDEYDVPAGRAQTFGSATLTWNATTGVVTVRRP